MKLKVMLLATCAVLSLTDLATSAELIFQRQGKSDEPQALVSLSNTSEQTIKVSASLDRKHWTSRSLPPKSFWELGVRDGNQPKVALRLRTASVVVDQDLVLGNRYECFWNEERNCWDVREVANRE